MALCVLAMLLLVIPACLSQQDLENKVFVFPKETSTDHVLLRPKLAEPLEKVSVCLRSFTKLSRPYSLFSLATPGKDNALLIFLSPSSTYVYINQMETLFRTAPDTLDWRHTCATWDSNTGQVQLWVNGKLYTGGVSSKGSPISTEASVILGQEQDTWGGGFESPQSFVGEMSDVHMWDYVLTPEDIKKVISGHHHGNVINWKSLEYEIKGDVLVKPKVWHMEGKMFVFPKDTSTAHVLLRPTMTNPLRKVSVCLYSYSELSLFYSLFTIVTPEVAGTIFNGFDPQSSRYYVYKNRTVNYFILQGSQPLDWRHTCVTWDSDTGVVQFWVNEKFYQGDVSMKATSIEPSSSIVLGKNDDLIGFGSPRSFVGEISDVHMWDYVLSPEDIQKVISGDLHGNVINWRSLICEIKGEALVKPKALHMDRKVFVFPKETSTAHVLLRPPLTDPLQKFSVCLRSYSDLSRSYSLFSLATPGKDNAFLIFLQPPNTYSVFINQEEIVFKTDPESLEWRHTCVTWDSVTGVVQLWVKGKRYPRKVCNKGSSIAAEASIVLGQEQDSFAGGFEAPQSFVGEICDVNMWDYVLTQGDIQNALYGYIQGNIINWKSLPLQMKGDVLIQPRD